MFSSQHMYSMCRRKCEDRYGHVRRYQKWNQTKSKKCNVKKERGNNKKLQLSVLKRMEMERYNEYVVIRSRAGTAPGVLNNSILFELVSIGKINMKDILISKTEGKWNFCHQVKEKNFDLKSTVKWKAKAENIFWDYRSVLSESYSSILSEK